MQDTGQTAGIFNAEPAPTARTAPTLALVADDDAVPPEILDFFRRVRDLVDQTVRQLELAAGASLTVTATMTTAEVAHADASALDPTVVITPEEVRRARRWLTAAGAAALIGTEIIERSEALIAFAERVLRMIGE